MRKIFVCVLAAMIAAAAGAQEFAVATNALDYANLGTLNLEASYAPATHWTIGAGVKYNPYTFRQRSVAINTRYWPWHKYSGWWVSGSVRYQEYNTGGYKTGRKVSNELTSEGDRLGGGVSSGYSYMLGKHFNLDMGLGVWAGYDVFRSYSCPTCGYTVKTGKKFFVLPSDFLLGISYLF